MAAGKKQKNKQIHKNAKKQIQMGNGGNKMRFGDVQDTRKKETRNERKTTNTRCFMHLMEKMYDANRDRRMATVGGVTFTI